MWKGTVSHPRARGRGHGFPEVQKENARAMAGQTTMCVPFLHGCVVCYESHSGQWPDPVRHLRRDYDPATLGMFG